jgi:hypothetical protein
MTTTVRSTAPKRVPMDSTRKISLVAGAFYLITFIASIPAQFYSYAPVLKHSDYIVGPGNDARVLSGGLLEVIAALAGIGTAVALFPVVKRQNEAVALGFVAARIYEAGLMLVGVVSILAVVTLRQDGASGAEATSLITAGDSLVAVHDWTFLLGPGTVPAMNALCLGYLLYKSRLVPRIIPTLGLIGAPLLLASAVATLFGVYSQASAIGALLTVPIFFWELSLGIWLVVKGFNPSPLTAGPTTLTAPPADRVVTV